MGKTLHFNTERSLRIAQQRQRNEDIKRRLRKGEAPEAIAACYGLVPYKVLKIGSLGE